jgi:cell division transport system permease protein
MSQVTYLVQEAFRTMKRHTAVAMVSIGIMSLSLLVLAMFLLVTDNMFLFMEHTRDEMRVYVYLSDELSQDGMNNLYKSIISMQGVDEVVFISKEEALSQFSKQLGDESGLLEAMESNPLPASFRISLQSQFKNKESIEKFSAAIGGMPGVGEVNYGKEFIDKFSSIVNAFLYIDAVIGFVVILSSIFIIAYTVQLAVVSRKETIGVLKLVGATNRFITTPFFIEGAFQGGVAAVVSLLLLAAIYLAGRNFIPALTFFSPEKAALFFAVCLCMGAVGSLAALRRFLRI